MLVSLSSILINFGVSYLMVTRTTFGHAGLALATSTVALSNFLVLFVILRNRIGGIHGSNLISTFLKVCAASAAMGAVVFLSSGWISNAFGVAPRARLLDLLVSIPIGVAVFYGVCRMLRVDELDLAMRAAAGPLARLWPSKRDKIQ